MAPAARLALWAKFVALVCARFLAAVQRPNNAAIPVSICKVMRTFAAIAPLHAQAARPAQMGLAVAPALNLYAAEPVSTQRPIANIAAIATMRVVMEPTRSASALRAAALWFARQDI